MILLAFAAAAAVTIADLSWMAGSWVQEADGAITRETWIAPMDGAMAGLAQTNRAGRKPFIEHMKLTEEPAGLTFTAITNGQPPTAFTLKSAQDGAYVFENLAHDMPQRVIYRRCEADLCARIEGNVNGELISQDWRYRRVP